MIQARNLGFPRMGAKRELKFALERYWYGKIGEIVLQQTASELRKAHWQLHDPMTRPGSKLTSTWHGDRKNLRPWK